MTKVVIGRMVVRNSYMPAKIEGPDVDVRIESIDADNCDGVISISGQAPISPQQKSEIESIIFGTKVNPLAAKYAAARLEHFDPEMVMLHLPDPLPENRAGWERILEIAGISSTIASFVLQLLAAFAS